MVPVLLPIATQLFDVRTGFTGPARCGSGCTGLRYLRGNGFLGGSLFRLGVGAVPFLLPLLFQMAQRELAPEEDNGSLFVVATPPDYSSVDYVNYFLDQMVSTWKQIPEVSHSWQVNNPGTVFGGIELNWWPAKIAETAMFLVDHQANQRIINAVRQKMKAPEEKVFSNIRDLGNTSSSTIPLCLETILREGGKGRRRLGLTAFGGGFTFGGGIVDLV